jgi:hypothetical protein
MEFDCECNIYACSQLPFDNKLKVLKSYDKRILDVEHIPEPIEKCEIRSEQIKKIAKLSIRLTELKHQYGIEE